MKIYILLLAVAYLNGGTLAEVGDVVAVGNDKNEITEERAAELVKAKRAEEVDVDEDGHVEDGLDGLTVAELKQLAGDEGVDIGRANSKAPILKAIREHRAASVDA